MMLTSRQTYSSTRSSITSNNYIFITLLLLACAFSMYENGKNNYELENIDGDDNYIHKNLRQHNIQQNNSIPKKNNVIYITLRNTLNLIVPCLAFLISLSFVYKIRLFVEELFYIKTVYNGDIYKVIKATLNYNTLSWSIIAVTFISYIILSTNADIRVFETIQENPAATVFTLASLLLLLSTVDILDCRATKVLRVFSSGGLDPGTAMAGSYFYGYLKIVLPASGGNERAGILTALEKYEAKNRIKIPVKKLFILIPSSSYIPPDLREASDDWMESSGELDCVAIDRAGVKNRTYHNTVYRIRSEGPNVAKPSVYLAVEGATPLKTFLEVQHQSHRYASLYREYNDEIIRNFYESLKNLLNDNPDCRDYCELIYYQDFVGNENINVAHVLLERIAQHTKSKFL